MVDAIKNTGYNIFTKVTGLLMGVLTESKFLEKGLLTPEEYVNAGDQLVQKCPTWAWQAGEEKS